MIYSWRKLRSDYPDFFYNNYEYRFQNRQLIINFYYDIPGLSQFNHELIVRNVDEVRLTKLNLQALENLIFHTGLILSLSYWKVACSKNINIEAGNLTSEGEKWFREVFVNGMGQYFYENRIDFIQKDFVNFKFKRVRDYDYAEVSSDKVLVPFSAGKDSTVTLNLLKDNMEMGLLMVYPQTFAAFDIANTTKLPLVEVESKIDHRLLDLNLAGYLNGHTPYSAFLFMVSLLAAYLFDFKYVAFSNEASSDEGNLSFKGMTINHQYSKTFGYEKVFSQYNSEFLSNIKIFSFLRPLYDIQISKIFGRYDEYFESIRSCNVGQKDGIWCGKCAKCLSTYILLSPFIDNDKLQKMFGKNLFADRNLYEMLDKLVGESIKPFECVGTKKELKVALYMTLNKYSEDLPDLLTYYKSKYQEGINDRDVNTMLSNWNKDNNLPENFDEILKRNI